MLSIDAKPAVEFRQLTCEIAGAARDVGNLVAHLGAVVLAAGDGVIDRQHGEEANRTSAELVRLKPKRRNSTAPSEAAMSTMHPAMKMALMRTILKRPRALDPRNDSYPDATSVHKL